MTAHRPSPLHRRAAYLLAAISFSTAVMMGNAQAASCPTNNFGDFVELFQSQPKIRITHVRQSLTLQQVEIQNGQALVRNDKVPNPSQELQNVLALQQSKNLTLTVVPPDRMILRDQNGESLVILVFEQENCWTLSRIEDWSLGQRLSSISVLGPAAIAVKRGDLYARLASETPSDSLIALYASALDSYLHGASLRSAEAAYAAAGLSLSGQAPQLPHQRMQDLLEASAQVIPEAGITLAYFHCDNGESGTDRPCANPEKALQALKDIARLSPQTALVELGNAYATGDIVPPNAEYALACFLEAQSQGVTGLDNAIKALESKGATVQSSLHCL